jgi:hypothetical protein
LFSVHTVTKFEKQVCFEKKQIDRYGGSCRKSRDFICKNISPKGELREGGRVEEGRGAMPTPTLSRD